MDYVFGARGDMRKIDNVSRLDIASEIDNVSEADDASDGDNVTHIVCARNESVNEICDRETTRERNL